VLARASAFFGWCLFYLFATVLIGLLPAMLVFMICYMRLQGRESWEITLSISFATWIVAYLLFHQIIKVVWPQSFLGDMLPFLRSASFFKIV